MKLNFRNPLWLILNEKLMNLWINSKIFVFLGASKFYCKKANFFSDFTKQKKNSFACLLDHHLFFLGFLLIIIIPLIIIILCCCCCFGHYLWKIILFVDWLSRLFIIHHHLVIRKKTNSSAVHIYDQSFHVRFLAWNLKKNSMMI